MRFVSALSAALLAWFVGKALNVPVWRDWDIGDRSDMTLVAFVCVWAAIGALRAKPEPSA